MSTNETMIECWNRQASEAWLHMQDRMDWLLDPLGTRALTALDLHGGEQVLDVGCGCGHTTLALARAVGAGGAVTGIDVSAPMLERAAARAQQAGLSTRIRWLLQDAQTAELGQNTYEAIYSRFGVMFFADAHAAFANLAGAARRGGRMAFVCWQSRQDNPWFELPARAAARHVEMVAPARDDEPGPFGFANGERLRELMTSSGWREVQLESLKEKLFLGDDLEQALQLLTTIGPVGAALRQREVSDSQRAQALEAVRAALLQFQDTDGMRAASAAWLVHAVR